MANKIDEVISELQKEITYLDWRDETRVTMRIDQVQKILKRVLNLAKGSQGEQKYDLLASGSHIDFTFEVGSDQVYQGPNVLNFGEVLKITAEAQTGYEITSLLVNGSAFTSGNTITINDTTCPQGYVSVQGTTVALAYDLSTNATNGYIIPFDQATNTRINEGVGVITTGQVLTFYFNAMQGNEWTSILVNGVEQITAPVEHYEITDYIVSGNVSVVGVAEPASVEPASLWLYYGNGVTSAEVLKDGEPVEEGDGTLNVGDVVDLDVAWGSGYTLKKIVIQNGDTTEDYDYDDQSGSLTLSNITVAGDLSIGITVTNGTNDLSVLVNGEPMSAGTLHATITFEQDGVAFTPTFVDGKAENSLTYGDTLVMTVTPEAGYVVEDISYTPDYLSSIPYTSGDDVTIDGDIEFDITISQEQ